MLDLLVAAAITAGSAGQQAGISGYYLSLVAPATTSPSGLVARAILPGQKSCPTLDVSGPSGAQSVPMVVRRPGSTTGKAFRSVLSCSANIPVGVTSAVINGRSIPAALPSQLSSVAALSDTGCRVDPKWQDCRSPNAWPLERMANDIARRDPDLVLHVGDYYYRERACPKSRRHWCGGSPRPPKGKPFIDTGQGWIDDFFRPTRALHSTAPLLAGRGNHETCNNAGNGYFLYLDVGDLGADACAPKKGRAPQNTLKPWYVDVPAIGGRTVRLVSVDSAYAADSQITDWSRRHRAMYSTANEWASDPSVQPFLLTHRPVLGLTTTRFRGRGSGPVKRWTPWISLDQTAASHGLIGHYRGILSGHMHLNQVVQVPGLPPQITAGGGGTALDPHKGYVRPKHGALAGPTGKPLVKGVKPYPKLAHRWQKVTFAYQWAGPSGVSGDWQFRFVSPAGRTVINCQVAESATCRM